jgi:hypothetical protein
MRMVEGDPDGPYVTSVELEFTLLFPPRQEVSLSSTGVNE